MRDGIGDVDAELLIRFVPSALSFALLKLMGLSKFPSTFQVQNNAGQWVEMPLATEHYFSTALGVGYDVTTRGYTERVSKETHGRFVIQLGFLCFEIPTEFFCEEFLS